MRQVAPEPGSWLSEPLRDAITRTLTAGDQALLFLNRRGYAPLTLCRACGHRLECPNCSTWLVEHRFRRQLMCHHCGHTAPVPQSCPRCETADALVPCGPGVERLAEEVATRFPDARMAILSSDLQRGASLRATIQEYVEETGSDWGRELLEELGYGGALVATAVNGTFVAREARADTGLSEGDAVEVVAPLQGG